MPDPAPKTVFLDRDGTINREKHHLSDPADLELLTGVGEALSCLQQAGCQLVVITNQSPIGRGMFDEERLGEIHARLAEMLAEHGVTIAGWYWCPHLPDAGCECRKPAPGMLNRAASELNVDFSNSWMIGDKVIDGGAGKAVGAKTILLATGYGDEQSRLPGREEAVDYFVPTLSDAADIILGKKQPHTPAAPAGATRNA